jgi:BASS family bile acid:Na+ symporter
MESSALLNILLPVSLGIIMFGLGLLLSVGDFTRVLIYPKPIFIGLLCQMALLPAVCIGIAKLFNLSPEISVGFILLSASPVGATSNFFTHLSKGDVVLSITLTAVSSLLCIFTLPIIVNFSMQVFMDESKYIPLQFSEVLKIFVIILLPVLAGMLLHKKYYSLAERLQKPVKIFSILFLVVLIVTQVIKEKSNIATYWQQTGLAVLSFSLMSMGAGFFIPRLFNTSKIQSIAISMGSVIHNCALAITIAISPALLNNSIMSIPAALYTVVMYFTAALFAYIMSIKLKLKNN